MLMSGSGRAARLHYLAGTFRVLSNGDHVICAVTGTRIPLHELRYWSVDRQEAYVDADASLQAEKKAGA
ncbi:DUF2093 domain-containing protein [Sphingomonas daechungensis]|uniref:DUF2093 domain-containing protein n=1 Tax=Sphingomonas daechungensis TaxID=1176646 RepID=A0ABX6T9C5_9SPHN|nr:DUF2093 domain-containing protein [Sphingomonas daechungensis]QNP44268.1 DUF2093 domain-containing protein [Sphingomonas daechungensis]